MELKPERGGDTKNILDSSNRTFMELKPAKPSVNGGIASRSNRTFMELKYWTWKVLNKKSWF